MNLLTRIFLLASAAFLLAFAAAACGKRQAAVPASSSISSVPARGDMFVSSSIGDATYLNPVLATDSASGDINSLVYNGLVKYDRNLKLTGDLAESWQVYDGGKRIVFKLREGVRWHDGAPFTADDVKFTYEKLTDPSVRTPYASDYLLVKNLRVLDKHTLEVAYKEPFAPALESWGMGIIPRHIFGAGDFNTHPNNRKPVGTGPFRFRQWVTDQKIALDSNPDYFEGAPYIARYIYRIIPDQAVQFLELRKESVDEMSLSPDQWRAYPEFFRHYSKFRYPSFSYVYMGFNLRLQPFSDKRFRKAVAMAVNKDDIIGGVLLGMGKAATGPFPPQSWAYDPSVKGTGYDPAGAEGLLKELGYTRPERGGYFEKDGKTLEFTILTNQGNKMRALTAEIIQAQLKAVGIKVNIRVIEWSAFIHQFIDKKAFEAVILGWNLSRDPDQYSIWHSGQTGEGMYNFISYSNPEVDRLLEEGRRTFGQEKRENIYRKIHALLADDLPYIFLYYPEALPCVHRRFRGIDPAPAGISWNFNKWWVNKEEQKYMGSSSMKNRISGL